jgi:hypothetical protein
MAKEIKTFENVQQDTTPILDLGETQFSISPNRTILLTIKYKVMFPDIPKILSSVQLDPNFQYAPATCVTLRKKEEFEILIVNKTGQKINGTLQWMAILAKY